MIRLTPYEQEMLDGKYGAAKQVALQKIIDYARILGAVGKQSSSRIGRIFVPVIAVALLVLSYSLILQPRYEEPENAYDMENSIWNIDQKDAYL